MNLQEQLKTVDLLDLIGRDSPLKKTATTYGGEWSGPCPFCGGEDRFNVWPDHPAGKGRWWCRCCNRSGDAIDYLQELQGLSFREALQVLKLEGQLVYARERGSSSRPLHPTLPPEATWQRAARDFAKGCERALWTPVGERAVDWLRGRGLEDRAIQGARLGYNATTHYDKWAEWGLKPRTGKRGVWLPRGIVIPWKIDDELWRINIRRPLTSGQLNAGQAKYVGPAGYRNALYNAGALSPNRPAILVEGDLDAITIMQHAGDVATPVAAGSTHGARKLRWFARLAVCPLVLVAFDADQAGDDAADYWVQNLENAKRWRPYWDDANGMASDGVDLRTWIATGTR